MDNIKLDVGTRVRVIHHPDQYQWVGLIGTVVDTSCYHRVQLDKHDAGAQLFLRTELEVLPPEPVAASKDVDVTGSEIAVGDTIVYFTHRGSVLRGQKAKVELIGTASGRGPHILVRREDAEKKNSFTRKAWLWSFKNAVKVG